MGVVKMNRPETLVIQAPAKINLSLDILRRRKDGYHDLCMVMQQIALCDLVRMRIIPESGIRLSTNADFLPVNHQNIAWQAAELLGNRAGINLSDSGVEIVIEKRIPVSAGLAGGSADAAAVLKGLNQLWRLGLSLGELQKFGLELGADVPYCLQGGTALAEGIGEQLTPLRMAKDLWVVLVKPPVSISTKEVYNRFNPEHVMQRPDTIALIDAMNRFELTAMAGAMANVLESVTLSMVPEISEIKSKMIEYNAFASFMTGSGPTVFGLFRTAEKARAAGTKLSRLYREVHITQTVRN
jgi:4-diphosphocytidyl-2-C-methyl-D-erythritol kinase